MYIITLRTFQADWINELTESKMNDTLFKRI